MSSAEAKAMLIRRSRKSIATLPTSDSTFDKENSTIQGIGSGETTRKAGGKKLRSKSIGPGGLEALGEGTGNLQKAFPAPRSILKPTMPLSPTKAIPPHPSFRKSSPSKDKAAASPARSPARPTRTLRQSGVENLPNPFEDAPKEQDADNGPTRVSLKSEEEQQAAAREREKKEILERRDARRQSLANRRVSFAPEATLHTWDVVELAEDATSSSEATNSTRRASSGSTLPASPFPGNQTDTLDSDPIDPPSPPPGEEIQVAASPAHQRDLHKKNRRRSSGIPPMNFNNPDEFSSSPLSSNGSDDTHQTFMTAEDVVDASDSDSDKDVDTRDETVTGIDMDITGQSIGSGKFHENAASPDQLDEALRQAAIQAGTQEIGYDENGEVSMDMDDSRVAKAFKPLLAKQVPQPANLSALQDQENVNPFSPAFRSNLDAAARDDDQEVTMEVTQAIGGILQSGAQNNQSPKRGRRKSVAAKRQSSVAKRRSSGGSAILEDETMEFTTALGGIQHRQISDNNQAGSEDDNEDMTMEFTAVVGGFVGRGGADSEARDNELANQQLQSSFVEDDNMELTTAVGGILSPVTERTESSETNTADMDFTAAVGSILPKDLRARTKSEAKVLMEEEADHGQLTRSPFPKPTPQDSLLAQGQLAVQASETGSPSIVGIQNRVTRRSVGSRQSAGSRQTTPLKKPTTPLKQITPRAERPGTPSKTPPAKNVSMRKTSPKKLFKSEIKKAAASTPKSSTTPKFSAPTLQFNEDATTGTSMPSVILTPRARTPSGLGIDQQGIGSPRAAARLDRRVSIGDQAASFAPQGGAAPSVRFADPRTLELELDNQRAEDQRRESGRGILQMEVDVNHEEEKDVTANLRDMIDSLTPKKTKLKGRKSLAFGGAARGLLGKRPAELDEDDEDATPKRLKGLDRSPVKNVLLPAPPSKSETTGRLGAAPRFNLGDTTGNMTPVAASVSPGKASTPRHQGHFRDTEAVKSASKPPVSFNEQLAGAPADPEAEVEDDRIHLQDFLNMTSIRFMELTTTKRRHTIAPSKATEDGGEDHTLQGEKAQLGDDRRLSACVVAGGSTIPMLELYQHSCRELKKYISEGRSIVREIEDDTFEENPPLFREYMSAPASVRSIMDNQFKNIKTHARLLSKAMWYEWRMKLLEGLKGGLLKIGNGLVEDSDLLAEQERILETVMPGLLEEHEKLDGEAKMLQSHADALADCNQDELKEVRDTLVATEDDIESKRKLLYELQAELRQQESTIEQASARKASCLQEIEEAERVREECRGWTSTEVSTLKASVDAIQRSTGWTISSAHGPSLTLTYRSSLSIFLNPSAFAPSAAPKAPNAPMSLTYTDPNDDTVAPSTTHRFFLQLLRARLLAVPQAQTRLCDITGLVSRGWDLAALVAAEADGLNAAYVTEAAIIGDEKLRVTASVLLRDMQTKVDASFEVAIGGAENEIEAEVEVSAEVVYGEDLREGKMEEFLTKRTAGVKGWAGALGDLEAKLKARGRKEKA